MSTGSERRWSRLAALVMLALGAVAIAAVWQVAVSHRDGSQATGTTTDELAIGLSPDEWTTDLATAVKRAAFTLVVPDSRWTNNRTLVKVSVPPDGNAAFLDYAAPADQSTGPEVRQPYLEVYESPWAYGDPAKAFLANVDRAPAEGKTVCKVAGLPALCVEPNSPSDLTGENPAYVQLVIDGIEVEVSGGNDLDVIRSIAASLATASPSSTR